MMADILSYFKLVNLPDETKEKWGIKVDAQNKRYDCIASAYHWGGIEALKTRSGKGKGQFKLVKIDAGNFVEAKPERLGEFALKGAGNINFSSIHLISTDLLNGFYVGTGEPPKGKTILKGKKTNPLFDYTNDGFVVLISPNWECMEVLVYHNARNFVKACALGLVDDEEEWKKLEQLRKEAKPFFEY